VPRRDTTAPRPQWRDTAPATAAHATRAAERAVDDPAALARAARIVRIALQRGKLTLSGLAGDADAT
jgi:hypothetical protein